jgi:hypothetical protein
VRVLDVDPGVVCIGRDGGDRREERQLVVARDSVGPLPDGVVRVAVAAERVPPLRGDMRRMEAEPGSRASSGALVATCW